MAIFLQKKLNKISVYSTRYVLCETFVFFVVKNLTTTDTKVSQRTLPVE